MRSKEQIMSMLEEPGIIAVVRAESSAQLLPACEALVKGGIVALELTMTTPGAIEALAQVTKEFGGTAVVGLGTVLDADTCRAAYEAGAEFAVSPVVREEFVALARKARRPLMLGAYSPTEAQAVSEAGADYIKIFPCDLLGPKYIRSLLAPLPHLRIVPTGEIEAGDVAEFFRAGVLAIGFGSTLVSNQILQGRDWAALTERARKLIAAALSA